jgi:hypothetical protein
VVAQCQIKKSKFKIVMEINRLAGIGGAAGIAIREFNFKHFGAIQPAIYRPNK